MVTARMRISRAWPLRVLIVPVALVTMLRFAMIIRAQEAATREASVPVLSAAAMRGEGVASDWSHRHLIFSHPGTAANALENGTYDRWSKIANDPRYLMQELKRTGTRTDLAGLHEEQSSPAVETSSEDPDAEAPIESRPGEILSGGRLPRGLTRALVPPPSPPSGIGHEFSPPEIHREARSARSLIEKDWSQTLGSVGTSGLGNFPATFTQTSASCTADFAVYNSGMAGSSSQPGIIAFNQLYNGCSSRPSVYWAFDTGGTIQTSVALSIDGSQVAFVQTDNTTGDADFVVLKWASSGTLTSPTVLASNSSYPACTAPCMISLPFSGSSTDTDSSPFIDYLSGSAYVGDDTGNMHKFTNIFSGGTPVEATSPWPVTLNTSTDAALASPVYDQISGKIFVGDYLANPLSNCEPGVKTPEGQCGYLYSIVAGSGAVVRSAQLDYNLGIYDSPIVDSSAGTVYAFAGADNSTNCSSGPCAAVYQFPVGFTAGAGGTEATVGAGYQHLMSGSFDNQYFTSSSPPSGHLYVVGGTGPQNNTLYAVTIASNVMTSGAATAGPQVATNYTDGYYAAGLQVTEFCNNSGNACSATQGTDYLFLSVLSFGSAFSSNPCLSQSLINGCIMGFTAPNSGAVSAGATPNGTLEEAGGTSGIVVDNGASGASNIYFSTLLSQTCGASGTGGCAVSATQAALH